MFNPTHTKSLKQVRSSAYFHHEDKTSSLGGTDSNQNGIRDDIESYINLKYSKQPDYANVYLDYAKALRLKLTSSINDPHTYKDISQLVIKRMICAHQIDLLNKTTDMYGDSTVILSLSQNTKTRRNEFIRLSSFANSSSLPLLNENHCKIKASGK